MQVFPTELIFRVSVFEELKETLKMVEEIKGENPHSSFKVTIEVNLR